MTKDRWLALESDMSLELTAEEIEQGWHFCLEFDGLLVGPGMAGDPDGTGEIQHCTESCGPEAMRAKKRYMRFLRRNRRALRPLRRKIFVDSTADITAELNAF